MDKYQQETTMVDTKLGNKRDLNSMSYQSFT